MPCPPPRDLPNLGIEPKSLVSPALADGFFTTTDTWEAPGTESCAGCRAFSPRGIITRSSEASGHRSLDPHPPGGEAHTRSFYGISPGLKSPCCLASPSPRGGPSLEILVWGLLRTWSKMPPKTGIGPRFCPPTPIRAHGCVGRGIHHPRCRMLGQLEGTPTNSQTQPWQRETHFWGLGETPGLAGVGGLPMHEHTGPVAPPGTPPPLPSSRPGLPGPAARLLIRLPGNRIALKALVSWVAMVSPHVSPWCPSLRCQRKGS